MTQPEFFNKSVLGVRGKALVAGGIQGWLLLTRLWLRRERSPRCSRFAAALVTPQGPTLEQSAPEGKHPWQGPTVEQFVKDYCWEKFTENFRDCTLEAEEGCEGFSP